MRNTAPTKKRRLPLHVHICAVFTFLLIVMSTALGIFNYQQNTRIILSSSEQLFEQIEQDVHLDLKNTYQPIQHALNFAGTQPERTTADT